MSRDKDPAGGRARRILERLTGSSESLEESAGRLEDSRVAERLRQIEQLFLLHGGERDNGSGPDAADVLFDWGHLQVLERLGEGSFGEVYRAYDRTLDRDVALKLLKSERGRPFQSQLFIHEARQLALVRHRNVLAVHGAAVHEGRPGLWTDLIVGHTAHDERYRESFERLDAVLELVESLALALQAVHGAGLVHGDVKPSNIMRDASGEWILMDFGASLDQRRAQGGPAMTSGTPLYMAPEVVLGAPPTPESDLYSLGATLYRVLTGEAPVQAGDWKGLQAFHEAGRQPASAVGHAGLDRRVARLVDALMRRKPGDRIRPEEVIERVRSIRAAPQRRFRLAALASIAVLLVLGLTLTSMGFYRANEARIEAEREQRNNAAVNEFLQRALASPSTTGRVRDLKVEEMLLKAADDVMPSLADQPAARAVVHRVLAESFNTLRMPHRAEEQIAIARKAMKELERPLPEIERGLTLQAARALELDDRHDESIAIAEDFLARNSTVLGESDRQVRWARIYQITNRLSLGRYDEAEDLLDTYFAEVPAPETATRHFGYEILQARANLYRMQGRYDQAVETAKEALDWLDRFPRSRPINRASALSNLALNYTHLGQWEAAIEAAGDVLDLQARIFGERSQEYLESLINLSGIQREAGQLEASRESLVRARELMLENPDIASAEQRLGVSMNLANVLNATGEQARGEAMIREAMDFATAQWGENNLNVLKLEYNLAELMNQQGRFEAAAALASLTLEKKAAALGETHAFTLLSMDNLAVALGGLGRGEEAVELHDRAYAALDGQLGAGHPFTLLAGRHRAAALRQFSPGRLSAEAVDALLQRHVETFGEDHPDTLRARALLAPE
ncbi:serine/threonine-protein kinase [Wenzhouxiangella sediminis]|uniref:Serine/threonine protein kinase n=1 Tax=Wenzhouxiangella sediminis TaxID=1792836 RepID=A0A3E1K5B1_9GAMM|nr:serine/threonine-protein kinase [Wenzhouxiangella sediminis]RFF28874.1 serine/threonine protein kinase [Wenzhouxiangella sediminis]